MDLDEQFNALKGYLRIGVPIAIVLVSISVKEFLSVRALACLDCWSPLHCWNRPSEGPCQSAARSDLRLHPDHCVALLGRHALPVPRCGHLGTANQNRWKMLCFGGIGYGVAVLACALMFWRGC